MPSGWSGPILAAAALVGGACNHFDNPDLVVDLRVLGMVAEPPEVITPYDPADPTAVTVDDLGSVEICALVADPADSRRLSYRMRACPPQSSGRCDESDPIIDIGGGTVDDPEEAAAPVQMCATLAASADLVTVIEESISADDLSGFGGVAVQIELEVIPDGGGEEDAVWAYKKVRYSPELPAGRTANRNPSLDGIVAARAPTGERGLEFDLPLGRCADIEPFVVAPGERVTLLPRETAGSREEYEIPTFDGGARHYAENLSYQWLTTAGGWNRFESGGDRDLAGNIPPLDSTFKAPRDADEIGDQLDVQLWIVQRDERGGQAWYQSCARVLP
jgi:hypothetical protein